MNIKRWDIWYTYATYFSSSLENLTEIAECLVTQRIAYCAIHRDGDTVWRCDRDDRIYRGSTSYDMNAAQDGMKFSYHPYDEQEPQIRGYVAEGWWQAALFRFHEIRQFGKESPLPPAYIRAFLGKILLRSERDSSQYACYPLLKLYASGVVLLEFRIISGHPSDTREFIDTYINLYKEEFSQVAASPGIAKMVPRAYAAYATEQSSILKRASLLFMGAKHDEAIDQYTFRHDAGDFEFQLAPLSDPQGENQSETLGSLSMTLFSVVAYALGGGMKGIRFLLRGPHLPYAVGAYWSGRPHVHLIRFDEQKEKADENQERFGKELAWVMGRVVPDQEGEPPYPLPCDLRPFGDYNAYIGLGVVLWVWSLSGLRQHEKWADPNDGQVIYVNQALGEMLEYGYVLYRRMLELSTKSASLDAVLSLRRSMTNLDMILSEAGQSGEIRELLRSGWAGWNLPDLRAAIQQSVEVSAAEAQTRDTRWRSAVTRRLAVFFGLLTGLPVIYAALDYLRGALGLFSVGNEALAKTLTVLIAAIIIVGLALFLSRPRR